MKTKNIIILLLLLAIAFFIGFKSNKVEVVKTKTETITKYDTIVDVIDNTKPTKIEKVYIRLKDTIKTHDTIEKVVFKDKKVNKYTYIDTLKNGRLESVILADTIYKRDVNLTTFNKETTTTTDNYIVPSNFMFGTDTDFYQGKATSTSLNLYYIHKDRWLVKGGMGIYFPTQTHFWTVGVAFKF